MTKLKYKLVKRKLNFGAQKGKVVYIATTCEPRKNWF